MATIVFLIDFQIGHIFPTFGLASDLAAHNHRVVYLGIPDAEQTVRENGFEFYPIMEDIYPLGFIKKISRKSPGQSAEVNLAEINDHLLPMLRENTLWSSLEKIQPDLIISSLFILLEANLVYIKTRLPQIIFIPFFIQMTLEEWLWKKLMFLSNEALEILNFSAKYGFILKNIPEFMAPIKKFNVLIPCPKELDLANALNIDNAHYIEPSVSYRKTHESFDWSAIPPDAKIIFASLGSQVHSSVYDIKKIRSFFCKMIEMMNSPLARGWHLILSLGAAEDVGALESFPPSITALRWVPQLEVLKRASLAITHGGLGTIKECIFYGVPMIVSPLVNDQMLNSQRIDDHNLGKRLDIDSAPVENIIATIDHIMNSQVIQKSVKEMQQVFHRYEESHRGVKIIEEILNA